MPPPRRLLSAAWDEEGPLPALSPWDPPKNVGFTAAAGGGGGDPRWEPFWPVTFSLRDRGTFSTQMVPVGGGVWWGQCQGRGGVPGRWVWVGRGRGRGWPVAVDSVSLCAHAVPARGHTGAETQGPPVHTTHLGKCWCIGKDTQHRRALTEHLLYAVTSQARRCVSSLSVMTSTLQMRRLRHREGKKLGLGPTAGQG